MDLSRFCAVASASEAVAASGKGEIWLARTGLRVAALGVAWLVPLWGGGLIGGACTITLAMASVIVMFHLLFWWTVTAFVNSRGWTDLPLT